MFNTTTSADSSSSLKSSLFATDSESSSTEISSKPSPKTQDAVDMYEKSAALSVETKSLIEVDASATLSSKPKSIFGKLGAVCNAFRGLKVPFKELEPLPDAAITGAMCSDMSIEGGALSARSAFKEEEVASETVKGTAAYASDDEYSFLVSPL